MDGVRRGGQGGGVRFPVAARRRRLSAVDRVVDAALGAPARFGAARLVVIDGPSGAGKSQLADAVVAELRTRGVDTALVRTDHYATWHEPVGWWPRLEREVLASLRHGEPARYRPVEWVDDRPQPGPEIVVDPPKVLVLEGVSSARRAIAHEVSLAVWVPGPDAATRLERAVARDGEATREHLQRWQGMERQWFAADGTAGRADLVVRPGG